MGKHYINGLRETAWEGADWVRLVQDATGSSEHGDESLGSLKFG
jgi:hypothetical protein